MGTLWLAGTVELLMEGVSEVLLTLESRGGARTILASILVELRELGTSSNWLALCCHLVCAHVFGHISKFSHHSICCLWYYKWFRLHKWQMMGWENLDTRYSFCVCCHTS